MNELTEYQYALTKQERLHDSESLPESSSSGSLLGAHDLR